MAEHVSRRTVIAGTAAAVPALAAMSPEMPVLSRSADAELLRLGRELDAAIRVMDALPEDATDAENDAANAAGAVIVRAILSIPATTLAGLLVKARAVQWCSWPCRLEPAHFGDTTDALLAGSIIDDLITIAGEGVSHG